TRSGWSWPDMDGSFPLHEDRPIGVAILAMGGQGGGVLADWIVALAEREGWYAQSTSVPGVAQRTGATIYYAEIIRPRPGRLPVLSLMPVPGDVDVVIAAEMMEAGRAIQRGLVAPARTTLIASTHRAYAVTEKARPGDGRADPDAVRTAALAASQRFLAADMQALAEGAGSVISAALFGALAASETLPFPREAFEQTVRDAGVGVEASLRAFAAGFDAVTAPAAAASPAPPAPPATPRGGLAAERAELDRALQRLQTEFPAPAQAMLRHGLARVIDYQDPAYGHEYLDRVARIAALDDAAHGYALTTEAARQVAVALAYDDVIRVADLKTRGSRLDRVRTEAGLREGQIIGTTEFFHPRLEEVCASLPARLGRAVESSPALSRLVGRAFARGRRIRTHTLRGYGLLYALAGMRRWRRSLLRHGGEQAHLAGFLALVEQHAPTDYPLALEILRCRRLVKGYSDTHARGIGKFGRVIGALPHLAGRADAADWVRRLRDAALADEDGKMLDGALATVATLTVVPTEQGETVR
ncbi:MAG TPA: indolepyruvate oxidoreductase subunit beta family protein, partial [Acetobacteraceae bacterium]|nr:indolepyruvate oxidoreductase subunit beta family protein [Acetobacteraceae bacterium]